MSQLSSSSRGTSESATCRTSYLEIRRRRWLDNFLVLGESRLVVQTRHKSDASTAVRVYLSYGSVPNYCT